MDFLNNDGNGFPDPTQTPEDNAPDIMPENSVDLNKNSYHFQTGDPVGFSPTEQKQQPEQGYTAPQYQEPQSYQPQNVHTMPDYQPGQSNTLPGHGGQGYGQQGYRDPSAADFKDGRLPYTGNSQNGGDPYTQGYQAPPASGSQYAYGEPYRNYPTGLATASLVIGIVSIVFAVLNAILFPLIIVPIVGLILGIVYKTKRFPVARGTSTAGIICCSLGIVFPILILVASFALVLGAGGMMEEYRTQNPEEYEQIMDQYESQMEPYFEQNPELRRQFEEIFE
jgi:hypothetical protein